MRLEPTTTLSDWHKLKILIMYDYSALKENVTLLLEVVFQRHLAKAGAGFHGINLNQLLWWYLSLRLTLFTCKYSRNSVGRYRREKVHSVLEEVEPDVIFYFAAQALVKKSIEDPIDTFETNVMGMVKFLGALEIGGQTEVDPDLDNERQSLQE